MKGYDQLLHIDGFPSPKPLKNNAEWGTREEVGVLEGGGSNCDRRLAAAVQRALAIRERLSSPAEDVKGIGAMRDLYISWLNQSPSHNGYSNNKNSACSTCGAETTSEEEISPPEIGIEKQCKGYSRFCLNEDGFNTSQGEGEDIGNKTSQNQNPPICRACCSVEDLRINADSPSRKKNFVKRVCKKLLRFSRKSATCFYF